MHSPKTLGEFKVAASWTFLIISKQDASIYRLGRILFVKDAFDK